MRKTILHADNINKRINMLPISLCSGYGTFSGCDSHTTLLILIQLFRLKAVQLQTVVHLIRSFEI